MGRKSQTQLSDFHFMALLLFISMLKFLVSLYIGFAIICNFYLKMNSKEVSDILEAQIWSYLPTCTTPVAQQVF